MQRMAETPETQAARGEYVPPSLIATALMEAGEVEVALDWLERAEQVRDPSMPYMAAVSVSTEDLQGHPRLPFPRWLIGLLLVMGATATAGVCERQAVSAARGVGQLTTV